MIRLELEELSSWLQDMEASDWRTRMDAIDKTCALALARPKVFVVHGKILKTMDRLSARLSDGNTKVVLSVLQNLLKFARTFGNDLDHATTTLIPAVCGNLASSNRQSGCARRT